MQSDSERFRPTSAVTHLPNEDRVHLRVPPYPDVRLEGVPPGAQITLHLAEYTYRHAG